MPEAVRLVVKVVSPFLYFASFLLLLAGSAWLFATLANFTGYEPHDPYFNNISLAARLLAGGAVLATINLILNRLEGASQPSALDRFRRCALLYLSLAVLSVAVLQDYLASRTETAYRQEVATPTVYTLLTVSYPVLIGVLVLLRERRRRNHPTAGDSA